MVADVAILTGKDGVAALLMPGQMASPLLMAMHAVSGAPMGRVSRGATHDHSGAPPRSQSPGAMPVRGSRTIYGLLYSITGPLGPATPPAGSTVISKRSGWATATGTMSAACPAVST
jgi:hypothetical protein